MAPEEEEFDRRIAAIHGFDGRPADSEATSKDVKQDMREAEFDAMIDAFLGVDYDPVKRRLVGAQQVALHVEQAKLSHQREQGEMSDEQYLDAANAVILDTFNECEKVLGSEDFRKLFDAPPHEATGLIDRAAFREGARGKAGSFAPAAPRHSPAAVAGEVPIGDADMESLYVNFFRVTGNPDEVLLDLGMYSQAIAATGPEPVHLSHRLIMNFVTAKKLTEVLRVVVARHEQGFGAIEVDPNRRRRFNPQPRPVG